MNVRAGQDSGFFFTQPTVDALTYAGDAGIDVVNMSFFVDPWLFNCRDNPADSPAEQAEQNTIREAVQRALTYAHRRNVTLIAAAGNQAIDYTRRSVDSSSPNFVSVPGQAPHARDIDPKVCASMPGEGKYVLPISAIGISTRKSYYSSFGKGYVKFAAPGGDFYDTADNRRDDSKGVLAAYPQALAEQRGELNPDGTPNVPYVVRSCDGATCGYYQFLQGTSMAAPHAAGVAALIISQDGKGTDASFGLRPGRVASRLRRSVTRHACPEPNPFTYTREVRQSDGTFVTVQTSHTCLGTLGSNGFYGKGIVNALQAVSD